MWKDYFYLTRRERTSVWSLTILVVVLQVGIWTSDRWMPSLVRYLQRHQATNRLLERLSENRLADGDQAADVAGNLSDKQRLTANGTASSYPRAVLSAFNPNTADSLQLVTLGIKPKVVRTIIKYRNKGGQFREPTDFSKIYGLDEATFSRLEPYIRLSAGKQQGIREEIEAPTVLSGDFRENSPTVSTQQAVSLDQQSAAATLQSTASLLHSTTSLHQTAASPQRSAAPASSNGTTQVNSLATAEKATPMVASTSRFEINAVDTFSLQLLKGIGPATAVRIVRYREQLGGFYAVQQLNEIKGLYPVVLETLTSSMTVNPDLIRKVNVNTASLEKLQAHPYLSFYQAKVIVEVRKARKAIKSLSELAAFKEFTAADMERLNWYLTL